MSTTSDHLLHENMKRDLISFSFPVHLTLTGKFVTYATVLSFVAHFEIVIAWDDEAYPLKSSSPALVYGFYHIFGRRLLLLLGLDAIIGSSLHEELSLKELENLVQ